MLNIKISAAFIKPFKIRMVMSALKRKFKRFLDIGDEKMRSQRDEAKTSQCPARKRWF